MRIAIEIDNIIRNNNNQALRYYRKGIDNFFDEEVDLDCTDLLSKLPFTSKEDMSVFREIDYPYELFGCANTCHKHLHVEMKDWMDEHENCEVIYFALDESNLIIQSTYFFLSKGSRVREVIFPKKPEDIWNYCDVAVTINKEVVESKPEGKTVIVINKSDNKELQEKADKCYNNILELLKDETFGCDDKNAAIPLIAYNNVAIDKKQTLFKKIKRNISNLFKKHG